MKKGFTLVEIIISIVLIIGIGTISIFSFNIIKKQKILNILSSKSKDILIAANLYIETNNEVKNKLYSSKNGVLIPLRKLEKEGLIDFENINIENEYIVTMLGSEVQGEECVSTYTFKSWEFPNDKVIYICTSEDKEDKKFDISNEMTKTEEIFYKGANPNNYVRFKVGTEWSDIDTNLFRILSIYNNKIKIVYNKVLPDWDITEAFNYTYETEASKKKELYDSIVYKNYLSLERYKQVYSCNGKQWSSTGSNDYTCTLSSYYTMEDYIASITNYDLLNTLSNNSTWLNQTYIASTGELHISCVNAICYQGSSHNYLPLLTLNENVKIVKDSSCSSTYASGTKDCPYLLECKDC